MEELTAGGLEKVEAEDQGKVKENEDTSVISQSASFREETNVVGDLPDQQKKALEELKQLVREALDKREFTAPPPPLPKEEKKAPAAEEKPVEATAVEAVVAEEQQPAKAKEEEAVMVAERVEAAVIDEDGTKTVEAIK